MLSVASSRKFRRIPTAIDDIPQAVNDDTPDGRFYETPDGRFPSITTILGYWSKPVLDAWRDRVGLEEANRISQRAADRGTHVHHIMEKYIQGETVPVHSYEIKELLDAFRKPIDENLEAYYAQEVPLWSRRLGVAGRCDLIAKWKGIEAVAICDFKTGSQDEFKIADKVEGYFLQTAAYGMMLWERTKINATHGVVITGSIESSRAQVLIREFRSKDVKELERRITHFNDRGQA